MDRTAEDYQKDLLWQTALETFYASLILKV